MLNLTYPLFFISLQVGMTIVSIPLMDKTGRRTLHLYGLGGMFIFSIFITISFLIKASRQDSCFRNLFYSFFLSHVNVFIVVVVVVCNETFDLSHILNRFCMLRLSYADGTAVCCFSFS
jgi:MFS family permease